MTSLESDALTTAKEIACFLKTKHGATRVVLFGSLAEGFFKDRSDIDLQPASFCEAAFRQRVLKEGVVLV